MKTWKIVALVVAGIAAAIGVLVAVIFYATSGVTEAGDEFFEAVREGDYQAAYALTSADSQRNNSLQDFQAYIEQNGFDEVSETTWSNRSIENNVGKLSGTLTTGSGAVIPVEIGLVSEAEGWKIHTIERANAGLGSNSGSGGSATADLPMAALQRSMVLTDTRVFASALSDESFDNFLPEWLEGVTEAELSGAFAQYRPQAQRIKEVTAQAPTITSAKVDEKGFLVLAGFFENAAGRYDFEYSYARRDGEDRLVQFHYWLK